jgi:small acid-soluble spore protein D (minor alpha/beta-type SASP)
MSKNSKVVPEAKAGLDRFKMESANEVGVTLNAGYNGNLTSKEAGSIGGNMVKKMIQNYEQGLNK